MYKRLIEHHIMSAYFDLDHPAKFAWAVGHTKLANWIIDKRHAKEAITYEQYASNAKIMGISTMNEEFFQKSIND